MLCEFERLIYPQKPVSPDNGFRIVKYRVCENLRDSRGNKIQDVKAVGYLLPTDKRLQYDLRGHWSRDGKYGVQFQVEDYQEVVAPTKEGIIAYLSSGKIKGIGPKMAEKIYAAFGPESLEIFEHHPERLLDIPGITSGKLEGILRTYLATRSTGEVIAFLAPFGVSQPGRQNRGKTGPGGPGNPQGAPLPAVRPGKRGFLPGGQNRPEPIVGPMLCRAGGRLPAAGAAHRRAAGPPVSG